MWRNALPPQDRAIACGEILFPPCGGRIRSLGERSEPRRSWMGGDAAQLPKVSARKSRTAALDRGRHFMTSRLARCSGTPHPNLPPQGRAIAFEKSAGDFPPPNWGRVSEGEATAILQKAIARFPHPALPRFGGGKNVLEIVICDCLAPQGGKGLTARVRLSMHSPCDGAASGGKLQS